ncbi:MAG: DUF2332 family protein [Propionibacteriales bacterium]|nr:DUF2332 family protein [Propionibacteriales bacterium]
MGSPMYAALLTRIAEDVADDGVCARVLRGHEHDPGPSALGLRLLGAVHRLVLSGEASGLARFYPSMGGSWALDAAWPHVLETLDSRGDDVRRFLGLPPQTNEVGRAAALMGGLQALTAARRMPIRLVELGASAGLNLLFDRYRFLGGEGDSVGPDDSPVVLDGASRGVHPAPGVRPEIRERCGCDVAPVDPTSEEGRLRVLSYVWPDQAERVERLRGALAIAGEEPVRVVTCTGSEALSSLRLVSGTTTEASSESSPFARLYFEPVRRTPGSPHEFLVVLQSWPGGARRILGSAPPHGLPMTWE